MVTNWPQGTILCLDHVLRQVERFQWAILSDTTDTLTTESLTHLESRGYFLAD